MTTAFIRRDVWTLASGDQSLLWYARAVDSMQKKPPSDPTSWSFQAAIHGTSISMPPPLPAWNQCRHGSWYFVVWHQMYVYFFERIVRDQVVALGGPSDWALPYWNYNQPSPRNALPLAFRENANSPTPALYVSQRNSSINGGAGLPPSITSPSFALSRPLFIGATEFGGGRTSPLGQFWSETGRLEQTPHNDVHVAIGGWMGNPDTAAQDPIFWLHHANIDRLWWIWEQHPGHADPSDPAWAKQAFGFFDIGGVPASLLGEKVLDIVRDLDYTYDSGAAVAVVGVELREGPVKWPDPWPSRVGAVGVQSAVAVEPVRQLVGATDRSFQLESDPVRVAVTIVPRALEESRAIVSGELQQRAYLEIDDIDAESNPGIVYGVYLNLSASPSPTELAQHHVGNVSLFGIERSKNPRGDEHAHGLHIAMEITEVLDQLVEEGSWTNGLELDVSFVPTSLEQSDRKSEGAAAAPPVSIGRVSVFFD